MKICTCCKLTKEESEFYKNKSRPDGLTTQCKTCVKMAGAKTRQRPESIRAKQNYHFSTKYGISIEEQEKMFEAQGYRCKLCKRIPTKPSVDHCHITGKVRGILCHKCNFALGLLDDNLYLVEEAVRYLKENS